MRNQEIDEAIVSMILDDAAYFEFTRGPLNPLQFLLYCGLRARREGYRYEADEAAMRYFAGRSH